MESRERFKRGDIDVDTLSEEKALQILAKIQKILRGVRALSYEAKFASSSSREPQVILINLIE